MPPDRLQVPKQHLVKPLSPRCAGLEFSFCILCLVINLPYALHKPLVIPNILFNCKRMLWVSCKAQEVRPAALLPSGKLVVCPVAVRNINCPFSANYLQRIAMAAAAFQLIDYRVFCGNHPVPECFAIHAPACLIPVPCSSLNHLPLQICIFISEVFLEPCQRVAYRCLANANPKEVKKHVSYAAHAVVCRNKQV